MRIYLYIIVEIRIILKLFKTPFIGINAGHKGCLFSGHFRYRIFIIIMKIICTAKIVFILVLASLTYASDPREDQDVAKYSFLYYYAKGKFKNSIFIYFMY